jgi:hypothetical protein
MFINKIIMFQEALQFKDVIIFYYNKQKCIIKINGRTPPLLTWHIFQIIVDLHFLITNACVLNWFNSH